MCEATTILMGGAALTQAIGQAQQGRAERDVLNNNANAALMQAQDARERGAVEEQAFRGKLKRMQGTQQAAMAASGVDPSSQSFQAIASDTAQMGEMDARTIRANAMREAYGLTTQAENLRMQGAKAEKLGRAQAYGTALTGLTQAGLNHYRLAKTGGTATFWR